MPTPRRSRILERAAYARTTGGPGGDFLVNDPSGFPSDYPPAMWWFGYDSGGGAYPIGPNGPYSTGSAAAVPAVTRATELVVGPLTGAPYRVVEGTPGRILPTPRWIADPMLTRPDFRLGPQIEPAVRRLARSTFWAEWLRSAIWYGLGAFVCQDDGNGYPLAGTLRVIHPGLLTTTDGYGVNEDGTLREEGRVWSVGSAGWPEGTVEFDRNGFVDIGPFRYRIVVLRNPLSPVDAQGMSAGVFAMSPTVFGLSGTIDSYQAGQFRAGVPNGYLKVEVPGMTQDQADTLKSRWLAAHGGDRRSIAVLNATTSFVPINLSPVDAALGEVKRLNVADVAFAFGLDPMTLGAGLNNSATYSNLRDAWQNHRDFGLGPWIAAVQDTLTALLPTSQAVMVNLDGFANPTAAERYAGYKVAIDAGIMLPEEARALEGLPPLEPPPPEPPTEPPDAPSPDQGDLP